MSPPSLFQHSTKTPFRKWSRASYTIYEMELAPSPGGAWLRPQVGWGFAPLAAASSPAGPPFEKGTLHPA